MSLSPDAATHRRELRDALKRDITTAIGDAHRAGVTDAPGIALFVTSSLAERGWL